MAIITFLLGLVLGVVNTAAYYRWLDRRTTQEFQPSLRPTPQPPTQYRVRTTGEEARKTATVRRLQIRQRRNDSPSR